jgi:hypothetical protein
MAANPRRLCPSCRSKRSPLAVECPVCGLRFTQADKPRPFLFQASALKQSKVLVAVATSDKRKTTIQAPALGRVAPVAVNLEVDPRETAPIHETPRLEMPAPPPVLSPFKDALGALGAKTQVSSFWPLVRLEAGEALLLYTLNGMVVLGVSWILHAPFFRFLQETWGLALPSHLALSWVLLMLPLVLVGQSPLMFLWNLTLAETVPERRVVFSLLHMFSVLAFPLSFLCMVLSPRHQTLAELLSGQEIIAKPSSRMR